MMKFVNSCLSHCNSVCKSLLSAKLHCIKYTFASNYKHLSCKYKISQDHCVIDINLLIVIVWYFNKKIDIIEFLNRIIIPLTIPVNIIMLLLVLI